MPRNLIHWTWVRSEAGCLKVEKHTPSLTGDQDLAKRAYAVPMAGGAVDPTKGVNNMWGEYPESINSD